MNPGDFPQAGCPAPRPAVQALPSVAHGALDFSELEQFGLQPDQVVDFSANTNPYGPPPGVRTALAAVVIDRYPDRETLGLRRALSAWLNLPAECILPGSGAAELIQLVGLAYLEPGQHVLVLGPTFGEYARAARLMGAAVDERRADPQAGFVLDPAAVEGWLGAAPYRLVFICNPNNPTAQSLPAAQIAAWAAAYPQTLFVVDEAYLAFTLGRVGSALDYRRPNLLALRSMTKDFALTGLRLGFAAGPPVLIEALRRVQPPWSVSEPAQAAGLAALAGLAHVSAGLERLHRETRRLQAGLAGLGWPLTGGETNFFLLNCGDGRALRAALRRQGLLVRDCASFGLPEYVRIAARLPEQNDRLLAALRQISQEWRR
ncbi:MAG: pyridoxal phosphate-dependent aminotransferase [Chloroflexota bacterium]